MSNVNLDRLHKADELHKRGLLNDEDYNIFIDKFKKDFCTQCGNPIMEDYNYCIKCGFYLR